MIASISLNSSSTAVADRRALIILLLRLAPEVLITKAHIDRAVFQAQRNGWCSLNKADASYASRCQRTST